MLPIRLEPQSKTLYMGNGQMVDLVHKESSDQYGIHEMPIKTIIDENQLKNLGNGQFYSNEIILVENKILQDITSW